MKNNDRYKSGSKKRLKSIIKTKLKTSFIGSLAAFEDNFGYLWDYDGSGDLTEEQEVFLDLWEQTRSQILDNGNNQIRELLKEVDNHEISWNRYNYEFRIGDKNG